MVAVNRFATDTDAELEMVREEALKAGKWLGTGLRLSEPTGMLGHRQARRSGWGAGCGIGMQQQALLERRPTRPASCHPCTPCSLPCHLPPGADEAAVAQHHGLGGAGAVDLANAVIRTCTKPADFKFTYPLDLSLKVGAG